MGRAPMKAINPTPPELELLKVLWSEGRLSARELHDKTAQVSGWSLSSTRKTLERMVAKGLIMLTEAHGVRLYRARARKLHTIAELWRGFAQGVLGDGAAATPNFVESELLSASEIAELKRLLANGE